MKKLQKNLLLSTTVFTCCSACQTPEINAGQKRPDKNRMNVLFIICDDLNCDMGCYDDPIVRTPNLDKIRQNAVRFNNAYCQYPFSGPSRASFLTGYAPDHVNVKDLETNFRTTVPDAVTLPELFKKNGYYTGRVGKIFHANVPNDIGGPGMDDHQSWRETFNPIGVDKTDGQGRITNLTPKRHLGSALAFWAVEGPDSEHTDAIGAGKACEMIRKCGDSPFFIAMGFYRPHSPYVAPKQYFDMYPLDRITLPEVPADDWDNKPLYGKFTNPLNWGLSPEDQKKAKRAYYATISFMDAQIGRLLKTLEMEGKADNTIIVFTSDHGYNLGEHGQWMKQALFEKTSRIPMFIYVPKKGYEHGKDCTSMVELMDLYPTLAGLCGLKGVPNDLDGENMTTLLKDAGQVLDDSAMTQVRRRVGKTFVEGRSIRVQRYRYTEWENGSKGGELYDYLTDPGEHVNHYGEEAYHEIQMNLKELLHQRIKSINK